MSLRLTGFTRFALNLVLWALALVVFPIPLSVVARSFRVEVLEQVRYTPATAETPAIAVPAADRSLALDRSTQPKVSAPASSSLSERVLVHLENAEKTEVDPWLRDDIRIAWITTLWAQKGVPDWSWRRNSPPYVAATYQVLHCDPEEVWPRIVARRRALLAAEYPKFFGGVRSPRKPAKSVSLAEYEQREKTRAA